MPRGLSSKFLCRGILSKRLPPASSVLSLDDDFIGSAGVLAGCATQTGTWADAIGAGFSLTGAGLLAPNSAAENVTVTEGWADADTTLYMVAPVAALAGIVFRYQNTNNFWQWRYDAAGTFNLFRKLAGAFTTPYTTGAIGAPAAPYTLGVRAVGSSIKVYINGVQQGAGITDASLSTATKVGVMSFNNITQRYDRITSTPL